MEKIKQSVVVLTAGTFSSVFHVAIGVRIPPQWKLQSSVQMITYCVTFLLKFFASYRA